MSTQRVLRATQLNELELVLAGVFGDQRYALPGHGVAATLAAEAEVGDTLDLIDSEGTRVATMVVERTTLWKGVAYVAGDVQPDRPLGSRYFAAHRVTTSSMHDLDLLLVADVGATPESSTTRVVVVDDGDLNALARQWRHYSEFSPLVMPMPASDHVDESERWALVEALMRNRGARSVATSVGHTAAAAGLVVFFTGLSGSGKSTLARALAERLALGGQRITLLDGDDVRALLSAGLSFSKADRDLNVRRIGWVAAQVAAHGAVAICAPIAPYHEARVAARSAARAVGAQFLLVHISTSLDVCAQRDRKGLYAEARAGRLRGLTGVDDPYEVPTDAELTIDAGDTPVDAAIDLIEQRVRDVALAPPAP